MMWKEISSFQAHERSVQGTREADAGPIVLRRCATGILPLALYLLFSCLFVPQAAYPQTIAHAIVKGRVLDDSTRSPLPLTNVFVSNSTIGAAADSMGRFVLREVQLGKQQIVASLVGYVAQTKALHLTDSTVYEVEFRLRPQAVQVQGVDIEAKEPIEWKRNLQRFLKDFLGSTPNAEQCKVLNPELLDFAIGGTGLFTATARGPLEIQNLALGYHVRCFLDYFTSMEKPVSVAPAQSRAPAPMPRPSPADIFSPRTYVPPPTQFEPLPPAKTQSTIELLCRTKFTPLESGDEKEIERWKENRKKTYLGSLRHFLSSLASNSSDKQGFELYETYGGRTSSGSAPRWKVVPGTLYTRGEFAFERTLSFTTPLHVVYEGGDETQTSILRLMRPSTVFYVNGMLADPLSITTYGTWANQRVADMLPTNYALEDN